jgi:hypothetical protein
MATAPDTTAQDEVLELCRDELARSIENGSTSKPDLIADLVRHLNNQLPEAARFFTGDYDDAGELSVPSGLFMGFNRPSMYTAEGDRVVTAAVIQLRHKILHQRIAEDEVKAAAEGLLADVEKTHPEVYDTEPRWFVTDAVNQACEIMRWKTRVDL